MYWQPDNGDAERLLSWSAREPFCAAPVHIASAEIMHCPTNRPSDSVVEQPSSGMLSGADCWHAGRSRQRLAWRAGLGRFNERPVYTTHTSFYLYS